MAGHLLNGVCLHNDEYLHIDCKSRCFAFMNAIILIASVVATATAAGNAVVALIKILGCSKCAIIVSLVLHCDSRHSAVYTGGTCIF